MAVHFLGLHVCACVLMCVGGGVVKQNDGRKLEERVFKAQMDSVQYI